MSDQHLAALQRKHEELDIKLSKEENRPFPDDHIIHSLKRQKLTLKDQMGNLLQKA